MLPVNTWTVYLHKNKINGKMYIGITHLKPEIRWGKNGNQYTKKKNPYFYNAIKKYGWDNFEHIILFTNLSESEAKEKEVELIKKYNTQVCKEQSCGYNITAGGDGFAGVKFSKETRDKMSVSHKGIKNNFYGKTHSQEQKDKWSKERSGKNVGENNGFYSKHHSKETRSILSKLASSRTGALNPNYNNHKLLGKNSPMYGKHLDDSVKAKISETRKRKHIGSKSVICLDTNTIYNSIKEAASETGFDSGSISKCCSGKINTVHGCKFAYYNGKSND